MKRFSLLTRLLSMRHRPHRRTRGLLAVPREGAALAPVPARLRPRRGVGVVRPTRSMAVSVAPVALDYQ